MQLKRRRKRKRYKKGDAGRTAGSGGREEERKE